MKSIDKKLKLSSRSETVDLLWTGGYDSTFRMLQLLYTERKQVQPIYIIDLKYKSPIHELTAMNNIRSEFAKMTAGKLLKPTIYIDKNEVEIDDEIIKAWTNIKERRHIGKQYIWLASLCKHYELEGIELSIEKDSGGSDSHSIAYYLVKSRRSSDLNTIFQYFSLPLLQLTRQDMQRIIEKEGWLNIMEMTWFCHHPIYHPFKKGIPCGICNPCRIAIQEGMGHRIPLLLRYSGRYLKKIYHSSPINFFK